MIDFFQLFELPRSAMVCAKHISEKYKQLAAQCHPDQGGDELEFNQLNDAYSVLRSASKRLKHLMDLAGTSYDRRGVVSDHLMNYFMSTGEILQQADALIQKKSTTTSALSLALLENESLLIQEKISEQIDQLTRQVDATLEQASTSNSYETGYRDLAFLENWQAQLKQRYGSLFV